MSKIAALLKKASKTNLTKAEAAQVRELEAVTAGHYVAFVDDGPESFDVQIQLEEDRVVAQQCDCLQTRGTCWHKTAVLLRLSNLVSNGILSAPNQDVVKTTKRRRKLSESELLLQDLNPSTVSQWLAEVFKKNKPLEQQFLLAFATVQKEYNTAEVADIINKSIDSVLKNRKKAAAKEIKKVVDLLTQALDPIESFIWLHLQEPLSFEIAAEVLKTIAAFEKRIIHNSNRLDKFTQQFLHRFSLRLNHIKDDAIWEQLVVQLLTPLYDYKELRTAPFEFLLLSEIYATATDKRKEELALQFEKLLQSYQKKELKLKAVISAFYLNVFIEQNRFAANWSYFEPIHYENDYNLLLLNQLKDIDPLLTIKYCRNIMRHNVRKEYNKPYQALIDALRYEV